MLLGIWKNIDELEECVSLDELNLILKAAHKREHRQQKFQAALKGINLDEDSGAKARYEEIEARAAARLAGKDPEAASWENLGISFETEEDLNQSLD